MNPTRDKFPDRYLIHNFSQPRGDEPVGRQPLPSHRQQSFDLQLAKSTLFQVGEWLASDPSYHISYKISWKLRADASLVNCDTVGTANDKRRSQRNEKSNEI